MKTGTHIIIAALVFVCLFAPSCQVDDRADDLSASYEGAFIDANTGDTVATEFFGAYLLFGDTRGDIQQPLTYFVKPDGTFFNGKAFPSTYKIWANGPFCRVDTLQVDLTGDNQINLTVVPAISVKIITADLPVARRLSLQVEYTINDGVSASGDIAIVYSTVPYPGQREATTNINNLSAVTYKKVSTFSGASGTAVLTASLKDGKHYYIRVCARIPGSDYWNYSGQVEATSEHVISVE